MMYDWFRFIEEKICLWVPIFQVNVDDNHQFRTKMKFGMRFEEGKKVFMVRDELVKAEKGNNNFGDSNGENGDKLCS